MKKVLSIIAALWLMTTAIAQHKNEEVRQLLQSEASQIVQTLNLEASKEKLVFNVLYHVQTRIEDLAFGTPNYDRLLGYINEERTEMMKVIMPSDKYKEYNKLYSPVENGKIQKLKDINNEFISSGSEENAILKKEKILVGNL